MQNTLQDESNEQIDKEFQIISKKNKNHDSGSKPQQNPQFAPTAAKGSSQNKLNKDLQLVWNLDKLSFSDQPIKRVNEGIPSYEEENNDHEMR
jgi:hypothetical protein